MGEGLGISVGSSLGWREGEGVGCKEGMSVGSSECSLEGLVVGIVDGVASGRVVGECEGERLGSPVGVGDGLREASLVGCRLGPAVGWLDGRSKGDTLGESLGSLVGLSVGLVVGAKVGATDGDGEGRGEGKLLGDGLGFLEIDGVAEGSIPNGGMKSKQFSQELAHRSLISIPNRFLLHHLFFLCFFAPTQVQFRVGVSGLPGFISNSNDESSSQQNPQEWGQLFWIGSFLLQNFFRRLMVVVTHMQFFFGLLLKMKVELLRQSSQVTVKYISRKVNNQRQSIFTFFIVTLLSYFRSLRCD